MMQENICQRCNRTTLEKIPIDFHGLKVDRDMFCSYCGEYNSFDNHNMYSLYFNTGYYLIELRYYLSINKSQITIKKMNSMKNGVENIKGFQSRGIKIKSKVYVIEDGNSYFYIYGNTPYPAGNDTINMPYFKPDLSDIPKLIDKLDKIMMLA